MKHLQLNTSILRDPAGIMKFIQDNSIDVACLQEVCYPTGSPNPIAKLATKNNFNYVEGIHFYYQTQNQTLSTAIISKYPIVDSICTYFNTNNYLPKQISDDSEFGFKIINDAKTDNFPGSRGLKNMLKSRCVVSALLDTPQGLLRTVTTCFTVSDLCTETEQMYNQAKLIYSLVTNAKNLPTIFCGDLNIRAQSYSVKKLSEALTCHTTNLTDTLSNDHRAKLADFPEGLAVDHVFSKNLSHISTQAIEAGLSDHKAIISEFS